MEYTGIQPHAPSHHVAVAGLPPDLPSLSRDIQTDVCIVGGGFAGLSAALHLAEHGISTVLLEAERVGWGASGRNGGQLHSGLRRDMDWMSQNFGVERAKALWGLAEEAKALFHDLCDRYAINCDWHPGLFECIHKTRHLDSEAAYVDTLRTLVGYEDFRWLDRDEISAATGTTGYFGGTRDGKAGHLNPAKYAFGLARAAADLGAQIYQGTKVQKLVGKTAETANGRVKAETFIIAGNGYLDGVDQDVETRVLPINNYIAVTEPLGDDQTAGGLIPGGEAAADSRFVVYYWRPTPDGRLSFGGGETYTRAFPKDIAGFVRPHLARIYPQLKDVKLDYAWGGTLGVTPTRFPYIRRVREGVYSAAGFSGQGVALAPFAGKIVADAIAGNAAAFDKFAGLPVPKFPGGTLLRTPLLIAAMSLYALRDRL